MAYVPINWTEQIPLNQGNLEHMETQYDEAMVGIAPVRMSHALPIQVEVVTSFPTNYAGRLIYHSGENQFYCGNGSTWLVIARQGDSGI